jgi:hypothetical protein
MAIQETIKDPEGIKEVNSIKVSNELKDFVSQVNADIEEAKTDRSTWENRQDVWEKKRYGVRPPKSFPWPGAANFVLPQIDSDINRLKPAYINLAFGITPIVNFIPYGPEDVEPAKKRECLFDWRVNTQVKLFTPYCLGVDYALSRGFTVFEIGWKFETRKYTKFLDLSEVDEEILSAFFMPEVNDDTLFWIIAEEVRCDMAFQENADEIKRVVEEFRAGETKFEMTFVEKSENRVEVIALDPRDEIFFPTWVRNLQESPFIERRFWTTKNEILRRMEDGKYEKYNETTVSSWSHRYAGYTTSQSIKNLRDGTSFRERGDDDILLKKVSTWYDIDGDGILEKVMTVYPDSDPESILSFIEVPYDHGMFPYVAVRRELNDAPILSSRGLPALDDDFQTGISTLFNQDIDAGTIATTPTVISRKNSVKNLKNLKYVPGLNVETENGVADYTIQQFPNVGQAHRFASMQYLKAWANDRIGNITAAISQANNPSGVGQLGQKTAKEVQAIESSSSQLQSMDLLVWQMQMAEVYFQIDSLYDQFGDEEEYVAITGEQPMKVTRKEVQGRFNRVPNGRLDNSNAVLRANKAFSVMQIFRGDPDIDQVELKRWYLSEVDDKMARRLLISPKQKMQMAQQAEKQKADAVRLQVGLKRAGNLIDLEKEIALAQIQGKKYAKD